MFLSSVQRQNINTHSQNVLGWLAGECMYIIHEVISLSPHSPSVWDVAAAPVESLPDEQGQEDSSRSGLWVWKTEGMKICVCDQIYIYKHQCIVNRIRNVMEKIIYSRFITNKVNIIKSFCFSFDDYGLQNMNICRM